MKWYILMEVDTRQVLSQPVYMSRVDASHRNVFLAKAGANNLRWRMMA